MNKELIEKTDKLVYDIVHTNEAMECVRNYQYQRDKMLELVAELKIVLEADEVLDCLCGTVDDGLLIFTNRTPIEKFLRSGKTLEEAIALAENARMYTNDLEELNPENLFNPEHLIKYKSLGECFASGVTEPDKI